ncbi:hypothetical protein BJX70DRAFT_99943 [Aspergillus crustosus]
MASVRLRKAFRYPDDSGDDHTRDDLDEEEQEQIIRQLTIENERRNLQYSLIFTTIPLLSTLVFIPSLLSLTNPGLFTRFLSFLSILSLSATAYTVKYVPPQRPDPKGKRPIRDPGLAVHVQTYIIPANSAVCILLALVYLATSGASTGTQPVIAYLVPAALLTSILIARQVMGSVDFKSLEDLRYEYKGA